jgi:hypothetical protein
MAKRKVGTFHNGFKMKAQMKIKIAISKKKKKRNLFVVLCISSYRYLITTDISPYIIELEKYSMLRETTLFFPSFCGGGGYFLCIHFNFFSHSRFPLQKPFSHSSFPCLYEGAPPSPNHSHLPALAFPYTGALNTLRPKVCLLLPLTANKSILCYICSQIHESLHL